MTGFYKDFTNVKGCLKGFTKSENNFVDLLVTIRVKDATQPCTFTKQVVNYYYWLAKLLQGTKIFP